MNEQPNRRIIVIDDNSLIHEDFRKILCGGAESESAADAGLDDLEASLFGKPSATTSMTSFEMSSAFQGQEGLLKVVEALSNGLPFAVAFVDVRMPPGWDGIETIERLMKADSHLQMVICTAHSDYTSRDIVNRLGETDRLLIIKKPFDQEEVRLTATALCGKWMLARKAEMKERELERLVASKTMEISYTRDLTVFALARLSESRDPETGEHLTRMRAYSQILAEQLHATNTFGAAIDAKFLDDLYRASPLHDIGKISIPDAVLLKPGRLTAEEFEIMKTHTTIGASTLDDASHHSIAGGFLKMAIEVARSHHERFDGNGYPDGLVGDQIPLAARIVAVADVFDALTSKRVYKEAMEVSKAKEIIVSDSGKHFDPRVVTAFEQCFERLLTVTMKYTDYGNIPLSAITCSVRDHVATPCLSPLTSIATSSIV